MATKIASTAVVGALLLGACVYLGPARDFDPRVFDSEPGWIGVRDVPLVRQRAPEDCGAAALATVLGYWGIPASLAEIQEACPPTPRQGIKAGALRDYAKSRGLVATLDPARGWRQSSFRGFEEEWGASANLVLLVLKAKEGS